MFQHLLKYLWKRKGKNLMISAEILLIFVVIFGVVVGFVHNTRLFQMTRGFDYEDRWRVSLETDGEALNKANPQLLDNFRRAILSMPEVETISFIQYEPYSNSAFVGDYRRPEQNQGFSTYFLKADDAAKATLAIPVVKGRWFGTQDEGAAEGVALINQRLAQKMFGHEDPTGKLITNSQPDEKDPQFYKVIGVIEDYRYFGEFMGRENIAILRHSAMTDTPLSNLVIKVKPGTPRNFEIKLHQQLRQVRNDIEYDISVLSESRDEMLRQKATFFAPPILITAFLLLMVSFGLFGVLWQNVNSRIPEIGLRRAIGASSRQIYGQIISEQVLLSSMAMAVAMVFLVQLPFTGVFAKFMDWSSFFLSAAIAMAVIYVVTIVCALYPAWLASRMNPTDALHYE